MTRREQTQYDAGVQEVQADIERERKLAPKKNALIGELHKACVSLEIFEASDEARYKQLNYWWERLLLHDGEIPDWEAGRIRRLCHIGTFARETRNEEK